MIKLSNPFEGMKRIPLSLSCAGLCLCGTALHAKDPVLVTPGTANWTNQTTATGTKTVFTLTGNTVLNWDQLNLAKGSEMEFNFVGGKTVVNFLGGTGTHFIDGTVTSNGIVAFFSPTADLQVNGSIIAKGVALATLNVDAKDFSDEDGYELSGSGTGNVLGVNGHIQATGGDVMLGGEVIIVGGAGQVEASGDVLVGASRNFTVAPSGDRRLTGKSDDGFVLHMGEMKGSRIEVNAGSDIGNQGTLDATGGRIFLRVGADGMITNEKSGIVLGDAVFEGSSGAPVLIPADEGDSAPAVNEGSLAFPNLTRPDGSQVTPVSAPISAPASGTPVSAPGNTPVKSPSAPHPESSPSGPQGSSNSGTSSRTLTYSVPMSASGDASREAAAVQRASRQVAQVNGSKALLQRSSFFGMRGGSSSTASR